MPPPTNAPEYQLTRISNTRHRNHRDPARALCPDEREEKGEDDGEEGDTGVLIELGGHDDHGDDGGEQHPANPHP